MSIKPAGARPQSDMDKNQAVAIIAAYDALVLRAIDIASNAPVNACVEQDDMPALCIDGNEAVLSWTEYDPDVWGERERLTTEEARFPVALLFLSETDLKAMQERAATEEAERKRAAEEINERLYREREERSERATLARLKNKYEK